MAEKAKITPPKIIRQEKFVVASAEKNEWGDLMVTSKLGNEYKIKQKRNHLFGIFQPEAEVVVGFASYMDREYIATATPSQQVISTETPIEAEKPLAEAPRPDKFGAGQREGMCWKEVGELIRSGKIVNVFGKENAKEITKQYRAYLVEFTTLTIDRTKLPQWEEK